MMAFSQIHKALLCSKIIKCENLQEIKVVLCSWSQKVVIESHSSN